MMQLNDDQERRAMELSVHAVHECEGYEAVDAMARELIWLRDQLKTCCKMVIDAGLVTGHADTVVDLMREVLAQVEELRLTSGTCLTLTVGQIRDLADFSGIVIDAASNYDPDDLETEVTITDCPDEGTAK